MASSSEQSEIESGFYDPNALCPHIIRLGVCLEPFACSIRHSLYNQNVAAFVPGGDVPEYVPNEQSTEQELGEDASAQLTGMFQNLGMQSEYFPETRGLFVNDFKECECCAGFINLCNGVACDHLGICYCVAQIMH